MLTLGGRTGQTVLQNQSKMDWSCALSSREIAFQVKPWVEFPTPTKKKRKKTNLPMCSCSSLQHMAMGNLGKGYIGTSDYFLQLHLYQQLSQQINQRSRGYRIDTQLTKSFLLLCNRICSWIALLAPLLVVTYQENISTEFLSNLIYDFDCFTNLQKDSTATLLDNLVHDKKTPVGKLYQSRYIMGWGDTGD
jgi:hypothetical protein